MGTHSGACHTESSFVSLQSGSLLQYGTNGAAFWLRSRVLAPLPSLWHHSHTLSYFVISPVAGSSCSHGGSQSIRTGGHQYGFMPIDMPQLHILPSWGPSGGLNFGGGFVQQGDLFPAVTASHHPGMHLYPGGHSMIFFFSFSVYSWHPHWSLPPKVTSLHGNLSRIATMSLSSSHGSQQLQN